MPYLHMSCPIDGDAELQKNFSGGHPNGFLGLSLNDGTILFLVILLDKTVPVGEDSLCITMIVSGQWYLV